MVCYDNFAHTFSQSRQNMSWPEIDAILDDIMTSGFASVLDIGCGNGRLLTEAKKHNKHTFSYTGSDASIGMIQEARLLHPDTPFVHVSMEDMGSIPEWQEGQFDAIVFLASFHHLRDEATRLAVLASAKRLLAKNGKIYMTNWNLRDQKKYQSSHTGNGDFSIKIGTDTRYYHGFLPEELEQLFAESGLIVCENSIFGNGRNILSIVKK